VKPVNILLGIAAVLAIVFVLINRQALGAPVEVSFGFARVSTSLGLILLALAIVLLAVFLALVLRMQLRLLGLHRQHSAELRTHRELAENAEASRITELREYLKQELAALTEAQRLSEQRLHEEIQATGNSLSACIGEIDERLERQWPRSDPP